MAPIAVAGLASLTGLVMTTSASAATTSDSTTYQANLQPLNHEQSSGSLTLKLNGNEATITEHVSGLAGSLPNDKDTLSSLNIPGALAGKPFPHVQHIHGLGEGKCPTMSADANGDGVVSTVEGQTAYGKIQTTLSTKGDTSPKAGTDVSIAPSGSSYDYSRTISLNDSTMQAIKNGNAVIVVHGLNPATAPKASLTTPNALGAKLPGESKDVALIATAPTLCGPLKASQMSSMPVGASPTGGGSTAGTENGWLFGLGGALIVGAAGVFLARRRFGHQN
jgi:hypothetical protein